MELVEYAQAVDHSRMPLLLRVLNALGWYAFLADIPLMAYAYCLVMARNGFPNLTMDEVTLLTCTGQGNTLRLLVTGERNSMPDQAPLPGDATGDVKKAAFVSGVTVTGILAVGFSLCRSRRAVGHHIGLPQTHDSDNLR